MPASTETNPARTIRGRLAWLLDEMRQRSAADGAGKAMSQQALADACGCSRQTFQRIAASGDMSIREYVAILASELLTDAQKLDLAMTVHHGTSFCASSVGHRRGDFNGDGREDKSDLLCGLIETSRNLTQSLERAYANRDGKTFSPAVGGEMNADFVEAMEHLRRLRHLAEKLTAAPLKAA